MRAEPIAAAVVRGYSEPSRGKIITKIGINRAAPPIPLNIAIVATHIAIGNINQYCVQSIFVPYSFSWDSLDNKAAT